MKNRVLLQRGLAMILVFAMTISYLTFGVAAEGVTYCGQDHVHTSECYVNPDAPQVTQATGPEVTESEATIPETSVPETTVPEATIPEATIPETTVPETTVPETSVPETTVTETTVSETSVPETTGPVLNASDPAQDLLTGASAGVLMGALIQANAPAAVSDMPVDGYYYFDLFAGDLMITGDGSTTTLTGYRFDGQNTAQEISVSFTGTEKIKVYVYQSNHLENYTQTGIINGILTIPEPTRVGGWASTITNNTDVEGVISAWSALSRPSTPYRIAVTKTVNCELVLDNIFSTYQVYGTGKQTGGLSFATTAETKNASLTVMLKGDNRVGNIYYCSAKGNKNSITFQDYPGQTHSGTLTAANIKNNANTNYWCAAIGGNDSGGVGESCDGIVINGGVIFAGTNERDDCSAIGGGGNGYGGITINGGTVTAVVSSSGAAIGGGIGKTSRGGPATVTITGGTVYAYNFSCVSGRYSNKNVKYIPAAAIGGGSSAQAVCDDSVVNISGGTVYAQSVGGTAIGGGSSSDNNGGSSTINITGGYIEAYSIPGVIGGQNVPAGVAIGGGTGYNIGGSATLNVSGNAILRTGSIGGGGFGDKEDVDAVPGIIGPAKVTITSGNLRGQIVMEGEGSFLNMSGGTINNEELAGVDYSNCYFVKENGGGACVETGTVTISGTALIQNTSAKLGGAIYLSNGNVTMTDGTIQNCEADFGGAVYVTGGNFTMSGGLIDGNAATGQNGEGGAVYVTGGNIYIGTEGCSLNDCLTVSNNTAVNGGAFAVAGAAPVMYCGTVVGNTATEKGGALYVSGQGGFTMYGGIIDGGTAESNAKLGGGVYLAGGIFTLNGEHAVIQNNSAANGAGVYLSGGNPNLLCGEMKNNVASGLGGGIYIDQWQVTLSPVGTVQISGNRAIDGAGIYIGGTPQNQASFAVNSQSSGIVEICENTASGSGAGVCINNGRFTLDSDHILLQRNRAVRGGAVAVLSGDFTMSAGTIGGTDNGNSAENGGAVYVSDGEVSVSGGSVLYNSASQNGGGIYVNGGEVALSGGHVDNNTAQKNGGGIAVNNGNIVMSGGYVNNNRAISGDGGGIYVTSSLGEVHVTVYSGYIQKNTAAGSGGAVGVKGGETSNIEVQIGVNLLHTFTDGILTPIPHASYLHTYCPVITDNTSSVSGGAFYITGGAQTELNMYCLEESGNACSGDTDINDVPLSDFLMVEGGKVTISTAADSTCDGSDHAYDNTDNCGHAVINGSVHVAGGTLDLFGNMDNPTFEKYITVDLTKEEDHYHDHRGFTHHVKLSYHENFNFNGVVDSTQTAIDLVVGEEHTISDSLYKHEGYEIYGWNTDPNATPDTQTGWYDNGKTYVFIHDEADKKDDGRNYYIGKSLTLYAIWEPNGYSVQFDPNVPDGEGYTGEKMENQRFTYNLAQRLTENTYGRVGYLFGGWTYVDDNKVTQTLTDGQEVMNLTAVKGGIVVLKAIWIECTAHNVEYTLTQDADNKAILTKTCTLCHRTGTVTLTGTDAVYDKKPHPAALVCSDSDWFRIEASQILYTGTKIGSSESVANPELSTNAGNYTATVTAPDGTAATVTYQIAKATQPAPPQKPTYTEPEGDSKIVTVHPIASNVSATTNLEAEYSARYYVDGTLQETSWHKAPMQNGVYQDISIELNESLKFYFVYVRYEGDDNYLPSDEVMADGTFLFAGDITLTFVVDEGITYQLEQSAGELSIDVTLSDQYYLVGGNTTITKEGDTLSLLTIDGPTPTGDFVIKRTTTPAPSSGAHIRILIGTTRKKPSITGAIQENEVFDPVTGNTAHISRDSAYTVLYSLKNYDTAVYQTPSLTFSSDIPAGTTVIMQSTASGKISYWSFTAGSATSAIPLTSFKRMGSANESFTMKNGDMDLQFVVDFSQTAGGCPGSALQTSLPLVKATSDAGVPDLSNGAPLTVTLADTAFTLTCNGGTGLTHTLHYSFSPAISASKWDHRDLALVLTCGNLPADAVISARINGVWRECRPYQDGTIIVRVGDQLSGTVELTLKSDMFPLEGDSYTLACQLYSARSIAEAAPMNGTPVAAEISCVYTTALKDFAVNIYEADDDHLFSSSESITVVVDQVLPAGYMIKVQLQHKDQGTDIYVNTGRRADANGNRYTFSLNGCVAGSYRVVAIVERDDGFTMTEAPYYFIIQ